MSLLGIDAGAASRGAASICGAASTPEAAGGAIEVTGGASAGGIGSGGGLFAAKLPTYSILAAPRRERRSSATILRLRSLSRYCLDRGGRRLQS